MLGRRVRFPSLRTFKMWCLVIYISLWQRNVWLEGQTTIDDCGGASLEVAAVVHEPECELLRLNFRAYSAMPVSQSVVHNELMDVKC